MKTIPIIILTLCLSLLFFSFNKSNSYTFMPIKQEKKNGAIKGTIVLPEKALKKVVRQKRSRNYSNRDIQLADRAKKYTEYEKSMIYLVPLNAENKKQKNDVRDLSQKDVSFQPGLLAIQKGSSVNFINRDNVFHNVFSTSDGYAFNIGKQDKDVDKIIKFDRTGTIQVFCDVHAFMSAIINIVDSPYFTTCDETGNFLIKDIPPGEYKVIGWHSNAEYPATIVEVKSAQFTVLNGLEFE